MHGFHAEAHVDPIQASRTYMILDMEPICMSHGIQYKQSSLYGQPYGPYVKPLWLALSDPCAFDIGVIAVQVPISTLYGACMVDYIGFVCISYRKYIDYGPI
jgi:hypothetical protein